MPVDGAPPPGRLTEVPLTTNSRLSAISTTSTHQNNPVSSSMGSLHEGAKWLWRKKWLIPMLHSQFWFSACFSLMAPFFPALVSPPLE